MPPPLETNQTLLTTTDAAKRCGVSGRTLLRWLDQGELSGLRTPGGHWRVEETVLDAFMASEAGRGGSAARDVPVASRGLRVLIVEDDPSQAAALARLVGLVVPGATVRLAADGFEAGLMLGESAPDLAFIDIEMPGLDGVEVVRRARQVPTLAATRFVVTSGRLTPDRIAALAALGVGDCLRKPISPERLEAILLPDAERGPRRA